MSKSGNDTGVTQEGYPQGGNPASVTTLVRVRKKWTRGQRVADIPHPYRARGQEVIWPPTGELHTVESVAHYEHDLDLLILSEEPVKRTSSFADKSIVTDSPSKRVATVSFGPNRGIPRQALLVKDDIKPGDTLYWPGGSGVNMLAGRYEVTQVLRAGGYAMSVILGDPVPTPLADPSPEEDAPSVKFAEDNAETKTADRLAAVERTAGNNSAVLGIALDAAMDHARITQELVGRVKALEAEAHEATSCANDDEVDVHVLLFARANHPPRSDDGWSMPHGYSLAAVVCEDWEEIEPVMRHVKEHGLRFPDTGRYSTTTDVRSDGWRTYRGGTCSVDERASVEWFGGPGGAWDHITTLDMPWRIDGLNADGFFLDRRIIGDNRSWAVCRARDLLWRSGRW